MIFFVENEADPSFGRTDGFDPAELAVCVGEETLRREGVSEEMLSGIEVSLYLVTADEIRKLNRDCRNIDAVTDVLSFPGLDFDGGDMPADVLATPGPDALDPETGHTLLGEIVINTARVLSQAEEYGHSVRREFAFLVAHSMLHLLGYDHERPEDASVMERKQEEVLGALGIVREGARVG